MQYNIMFNIIVLFCNSVHFTTTVLNKDIEFMFFHDVRFCFYCLNNNCDVLNQVIYIILNNKQF